MKRFLFVLLCAVDSCLQAAEPIVINLWPAAPPGPAAKVTGAEADMTKAEDKLIAGRRIIKLGNVSTPQMHVYLPAKEKANGGAVLVCPGGGFSILAWDLEGTEVAQWLNSIGFTAVVLKYRVPTKDHGDALNEAGNAPLKAVGPVMDAQRAMSITRAHVAEWGLNAKRIGIMGFSAGGETAGLTALLRDTRLYSKMDAADEQSCAPNFALPIYPGGFYDKEGGGLKPYIKVTKDTAEFSFTIKAAANAPAGNNQNLFAQILIPENGDMVIHNLGTGRLRIDTPPPPKPNEPPPMEAVPMPEPMPVAVVVAPPRPLSRLEMLRLQQKEKTQPAPAAAP